MNFSVILPIYIKPRLTALSQPLWMAAHTSDWGDSLNQGRRGGKLNTMMMMFVARVVLMFNRFLILFLLYDIYGAGVFVPAQKFFVTTRTQKELSLLIPPLTNTTSTKQLMLGLSIDT